jgi:16S rRNA (adenine1518-N6/adenine1519-N6)-dimethyltransferase
MLNAAHHPRKRFGQHFLHDRSVIQKIIAALNLQRSDLVCEIGPGLGALTTHILPCVERLDVVEFDRDVIPQLVANCQRLGQLNVHQADALRFDFTSLASIERSLRIVGNLPYNISTPLLFHLLTQAQVIKDLHLMLQKEVVERIVATPGHKAYGRLSVMVQYHCAVTMLFTVKPGAFTPPPQVDSAVIRLVPHPVVPFIAHDAKIFAEVVRLAFNQRRKTLRNSLRTLLTPEQLIETAIDPQQRAEELSVEDYVRLANLLDDVNKINSVPL